jgi:hypothetical protein
LEEHSKAQLTNSLMAWRITGLQLHHHILRKTHTAADALSRPEGVDKGEQDNQDIVMLFKDVFINKITTITDKET